jgi:glycosyltransferase involved in cell wall biosynthesis
MPNPDDKTPSVSKPFFSVVLPIRNEAEFIEETIRGFLDNDYPADRFEVICVDGMSNDGTRELIQRMAEQDSRVRLVDNPKRITPVGMNLGITASQGEIVQIIGGHVTVDRCFISECARAFVKHPETWTVGGTMETVGTSYMGRAIAAAMSSPIGVGPKNSRVLGRPEGFYDGVPFPACRRWVYDRIGMYDEQLVRHQDDEFLYRLRMAGGLQYLNPKVRSRYYSRPSLGKLARQYYQYGFWRIRTLQKHKRPARPRQIAPILFILCWIVLIAAGLLWRPALWALAGFAGLYVLGLAIGVKKAARTHGWAAAMLPVACALMHFGYGIGTLKGVWSWWILRGRFVPKAEDYAMSR